MAHDLRKMLVLTAALILSLSGALVILASSYPLKTDPLVLATTVYTYLASLFTEKKIYLPKRVRAIYNRLWFDRAALFMYVPSAIMIFFIGYTYSSFLVVATLFVSVLTSIVIGLLASAFLLLFNVLLTFRGGG